MEIVFSAETIEWRGPAPFIFVPIPEDISADIKAISSRLTYGWGCIPVTARIGETTFTTSLFPRKGIYLLPVKVHVQRAEGVQLGDLVEAALTLPLPQ